MYIQNIWNIFSLLMTIRMDIRMGAKEKNIHKLNIINAFHCPYIEKFSWCYHSLVLFVCCMHEKWSLLYKQINKLFRKWIDVIDKYFWALLNFEQKLQTIQQYLIAWRYLKKSIQHTLVLYVWSAHEIFANGHFTENICAISDFDIYNIYILYKVLLWWSCDDRTSSYGHIGILLCHRASVFCNQLCTPPKCKIKLYSK